MPDPSDRAEPETVPAEEPVEPIPSAGPTPKTPDVDPDPVSAAGSAEPQAARVESVHAEGESDDSPIQEDIEALGAEERLVEEAAQRPASGADRPVPFRHDGDAAFLFGALILAVLLFVGWIGGTAIWQLRKDVADLSRQLQSVERRALRSEWARTRASLLRAQADLRGARDSLPPELALELEQVEQALKAVSRQLETDPWTRRQ